MRNLVSRYTTKCAVKNENVANMQFASSDQYINYTLDFRVQTGTFIQNELLGYSP